MSTWNYRIGTYIFDYKEKFPDMISMQDHEPERLFCVISAYYTDGIMDSYGLNKGNILDGLDDPEVIKDMAEKILEAYKKPIIDLDNWPLPYKSRKTQEAKYFAKANELKQELKEKNETENPFEKYRDSSLFPNNRKV